MMKKILLMILCCGSMQLFAQVQLNKPIQLTGSGTDAKIEGIQDVTNPDDAASKAYVDTTIAKLLGPDPCAGLDSVLYYGTYYNVKAIGDLCWFTESLNTDYEAGGGGLSKTCPNNQPVNCINYGGLYTWTTAMNGGVSGNLEPSGVQGICPNGWHLPSQAEFDQLMGAVTWDATLGGLRLKESGLTYWQDYSSGRYLGNNSSGFSARGAGIYQSGNPSQFQQRASFWSATEYNVNGAYILSMSYNSNNIGLTANLDKVNYMLSVRCVKDY